MASNPPSGNNKKPVTGRTRTVVVGIDKAILWFARHWLGAFNVIVAVYVGLPVLAPALMEAGVTGPAKAIYVAYSPLCHQMATRSFFLFGEQVAYPRAEANFAALGTFEEYAVNASEFADINLTNDNWEQVFLRARTFLGNDQMGYKTALCQRDLGIYFFIFVFGLLYAVLRGRFKVRALPFWAFLVFGMGPIGLDGFSQLFGYFGLLSGPLGTVLGLFPVRESTPVLRTLTGAWFGFCLAWLAYPNIEPGMKETVRDLTAKLTRSGDL